MKPFKHRRIDARPTILTMDFYYLKLTWALLLLLNVIKCNDSENDDVSTIGSCQWRLEEFYHKIYCDYAGPNNAQAITDIDMRPSLMPTYSSSTASEVAVCQLANTTELAEKLAKMVTLRVACEVEAVGGFPVMDAGTFKPFVNVENMVINNMSTPLPPGIFCDLPKLKSLHLNSVDLGNMGHLGLCSWFNCGRTKLEKLTVVFTAITSNGKLIPLDCMTNLKVLSLRKNDLEEIHPDAFVNLVNLINLDLSYNRLTTANGTFRNQKKLESLNLAGNRFNRVPIGTNHPNDGLYQLKSLNLEDNHLTSLNNETFAGMASSLEFLYLSNNSISRINAGAFGSMNLLIRLNLKANNLTQVPCLEGLFKLKSLYLSENAISTIEDSLLAFTSLEYLYMADNLLTGLTSRTFTDQRKLKRLYLKNNRILEIAQDAFATTKALDTLDLGANRLTSMPNLRGLAELNDLRLNDNLIDEVSPDSFIHLVNLRDLNLNGNLLHTLNDNSFTALAKLKNLHLADNEIISISNETFAGLDSLQMLNLSGNKMADFQYLWFPPSLLKLNLSRNSIEEIAGPSDWISGLFEIDLSHNAISSINSKSFSKSVKYLSLNDNRVSRLAPGILQHMTRLRSVNLERNQIRSLDILSNYINSRMKWRVSFWLRGNRLLCDCNLDWILTNHKRRSFEIKDFQNLTCEIGFQKPKADAVMDYEILGGNKTNATSDAALVSTTAEEDFLCKYPNGQSAEEPQRCSAYYKVDDVVGTLDCSRRNYSSVPPFLNVNPNDYSLYQIEELYLDNNKISIVRNELRKYRSLKRFFLNNNVVEFLNKQPFKGLTKLELLRLDHNLLTQLPSESYSLFDNDHQQLFADLKNLLTLDLSHNRLSTLSPRLFTPLTSLQSLKLNDNRLVDYPVWMLPAASEIGLQSNPWSCECDYAWQYRKWIQNFRGKLIDKGNLLCVQDNRPSVSLITFNISECYEGTESKVFIFVSPAWHTKAWLVSFPALLIVVAILIFVYRQEMQVLIYSRYRWRLFYEVNDQDDEDKAYDAFLSYSTADEDFVLGELMPGLEDIENPYSLCLHHRDFPIGAFINESIFNSIGSSRRSILILSENFVRSDWCRFEFRAAHSQMLQDKCKRVIVIILGKIPDQLDDEMKLYLRTYTYLVWGDRLFWKKLYFALPDLPTIEHRS